MIMMCAIECVSGQISQTKRGAFDHAWELYREIFPLKPSITPLLPNPKSQTARGCYCGGAQTSSLVGIFSSFDYNNDDMLTFNKLYLTLHRLGFEACTIGVTWARGKPSIFFDWDGSIMDDDEVAAESNLLEAFKVFDEDDDGFISARELLSVLQKLVVSEGKDMDHVELMICSVDSNKDGFVASHEFKNLMQGVPVCTS
ncbi:hypothetical protein ACLOJK_000066 [Asimina triloba]